MNANLDQALTASQQLTRVVVRVGAAVARWAATLGWGKLFILAILLLIAQTIVTDDVLHWDEQPGQGLSHKSAKRHAAAAAKDVDEVHIGWDGIRVRSGPAGDSTDTPSATGTDAQAAASASAPGPVASAAGAPGADPSTTSASGASHRAGPSVDVITGEDDDSGARVEARRKRGLARWLRDAIQGTLMLFIVYLIASKIVLRQTARSDARAAQAEASAAAAAADAGHEALQRQLAEAQLQALQAQVEPHFLFNTLASVDYLIETDPARASAMQKNLIQYLRAALPQMRTQSSQLGREADLSRAYLEILRMRMEERLRVVVDVPDGLRSAEFPPMMLQTLVENAIQHGVEPKPEGGEVRVAARVVDGNLEVTVADTGVGLAAAASGGTAGGGVGLANVRERLQRLYGEQASFGLAARQPEGAIATLRLPYRVAGSGAPGAAAPGPATSPVTGPTGAPA